MICTLLLSLFRGRKVVQSQTLPQRKRGRKNNDLYVIGEFSKSKVLLLSNVYVMNHWFLALIGAYGYEALISMVNLQHDCEVFVDKMLLIPYIWFGKQHRKPPDKESTFLDNDKMMSWSDYMILKLDKIEDTVYEMLQVDIDISYSMFILSLFAKEAVMNLLETTFSIEFESNTNDQCSNENGNYFDELLKTHTTKVEIYKSANRRLCKHLRNEIVHCKLQVSLSAKSKTKNVEDVLILDSDSYHFAIDTCTTFSICKEKELFFGKIKKLNNVHIQGVGGKTKVHGYGSIRIRITDDDGIQNDLEIHDVLYVPSSPANLISPQQWSQSCSNPNGTGEITVGESTLLFWNDRKHSKLIPHHPELKIPIMSVNDGYTKWNTMLSLSKLASLYLPTPSIDSQTSMVLENETKEVNIVPIDDEEDSIHRIEPTHVPRDPPSDVPHIIEATDDEASNDDDSRISNRESEDDFSIRDESSLEDIDDFEDDDSIESQAGATESEPEVSENEIEQLANDLKQTVTDDQRELMQYHLKLKHLPFGDVKKLAEKGIIPKRLAKVKPPLCHSCLMGKQHKKPWRGRGKTIRSIRKPHENFPGANTSTDQMLSPYGGLIPQMKGKLMRAKYYGATIFVDHFTDYTYVHLMKDTKSESTIEAKNAYESLMKSYGHDVRKYHADNGRYAESLFVQDVKDKGQQISYCGVGSHHQNGIAERRIKSLGEDARAMLSHGQHLWPEVVKKNLWPFAYKAACRVRNKFKLNEDLHSPEEKLSGVATKQVVKNEHPLFCPVYALDKRLQGTIGGLPKWNPRSNAGVYLGHSPQHSSDVALVLNLNTGLVSPQYHVVFDDNFSTIDHIRSKKEPNNWETLCKFHMENYKMDGNVPSGNDIGPELRANVNNNETPPANSTGSMTEQRRVRFDDDQTIPPPVLAQEGEVNEDPALSQANGEDLQFEVGNDEENTSLHSQDPVEATEGEMLDDNVQPTQIENEEAAPNEEDQNENRRSRRQKKPSAKMMDPLNNTLREAMGLITSLFITIPDAPKLAYVSFKSQVKERFDSIIEKHIFYDTAVQLNVDGSLNSVHPLTFATQTSGNEVYHFHQAMQEPDSAQFI